VGRIEYADGSSGVLVYLKASMGGHEDTSVLQYKASNPAFPHESTGDQFYGEDQFESYRRLGQEVAASAFDKDGYAADIITWAEQRLAAHEAEADAAHARSSHTAHPDAGGPLQTEALTGHGAGV
jgi:hypothetical protein